MKIKELLDIASAGYGEPGFDLGDWYDEEGKPKKGEGDGLAEFVVLEIRDTFDEGASSADQLEEAMRVMSAAERDLNGVWQALYATREE